MYLTTIGAGGVGRVREEGLGSLKFRQETPFCEYFSLISRQKDGFSPFLLELSLKKGGFGKIQDKC